MLKPAITLLLWFVCLPSVAMAQETSESTLPADWPLSTLESEGINPEPVIQVANQIRSQAYKNIHSFLIVRNGKLVFEAYYTGTDGARDVVEFGEQTLHDTRSVSKSITSTLIGIAIDRGYIDSVDVPIARFFPEYARHLTEEKERITLKHLLTMTAGFNWDQSGAHNSEPGSLNSEAQMENAIDFIEYVLSRDMSDEPGSRFNYNSGCFILLAGVIKRASGMHVDKFADNHLFAPLGIDHSEWWYTKSGLPQTHAGLRLRPRDMAKIGQLYVDNGRFHGRQVVSAAWISESAKGHYSNDRYGFGWWLDHFPYHGRSVDVLAAEGNGGQFIFAIPELSLVIVFTGGNYGSSVANQVFRIAIDHVLPAVSETKNGE